MNYQKKASAFYPLCSLLSFRNQGGDGIESAKKRKKISALLILIISSLLISLVYALKSEDQVDELKLWLQSRYPGYACGGHTLKEAVESVGDFAAYLPVDRQANGSIANNPGFFFPLGEDNKAYMHLPVTDKNAVRELREGLNDHPHLKELVLDLRGNTGGNMACACDILDLLTVEEDYGYLLLRNGKKIVLRGNEKRLFFGKITVLIGKDTASAAELMAGVLEKNGGLLLGESTFGKNTVMKAYGILKKPSEENKEPCISLKEGSSRGYDLEDYYGIALLPEGKFYFQDGSTVGKEGISPQGFLCDSDQSEIEKLKRKERKENHEK